MKALTVHAPWAWLIVHGHKPIENREWAPPLSQLHVGHYFAIHQGKSWDQAGADLAKELGIDVPTREAMEAAGLLGAVVGVVRLAGFAKDPDKLFPDLAAMRWWAGPIAWILEEPRAIPPIPWRGFQKLWSVPSELWDQINRLLNAGDDLAARAGALHNVGPKL